MVILAKMFPLARAAGYVRAALTRYLPQAFRTGVRIVDGLQLRERQFQEADEIGKHFVGLAIGRFVDLLSRSAARR